MITATITPVKNQYLATFLVQIKRPDMANYQIFENAILATGKEAESWSIKTYKNWLKKEIKRFCTQREMAYLKAGVNSNQVAVALNQLRKIKDCPSLTTVCLFIVNNQQILRLLVPNKNSAQFYWSYTIEDIITNAHNYVMLNQKLVQA
jgi:hypothetical protein